MEPTRPVNPRHAAAQSHEQPQPGHAANRKNERMARRELLYTVVRESMVRAGVLSASYKFKVLSLDARGRQFLVMVDLAREAAGETVQLAEIEALIAQAAKSRYDIMVTSVYWRLNEHVAVGMPSHRAARGTPSQPVPLEPTATDSQPAELTPVQGAQPAAAAASAVAPAPRPAGRFEPIAEDEVAAFKAALAAGTARTATPESRAAAVARAFDGSTKHGPQSYTLLTGFEDTEMPDADQRNMPQLSGTQYGDLR